MNVPSSESISILFSICKVILMGEVGMYIIMYFGTECKDRSHRVSNLRLVFLGYIFISSCNCCSRSILRRIVRRAVLTLVLEGDRRGNLQFFIFLVVAIRSAAVRKPS